MTTGQSASAIIEWLSGPIEGTACKTAEFFAVTAPDARTPTRLAFAAKPTSICKLEVHPVLKGSTGDT